MVFGVGPSSDRFAIFVEESGTVGLPVGALHDILLDVAVQCGGFAGGDRVWVTRGAWNAFLARFRDLERTRRGEAELIGLRPEEFRARFFVYDLPGHCAVDGHVTRTRYVAGTARQLRLAYQLEFDPGDLAPALREFESYAVSR